MEKVFQVTLRRTDKAHVVAVAGELDVATVPELEHVLAGLSGRVVIDCSKLRFIDAGAIRALVRLSPRFDSLRLVDVAPFIRKVLAVVELDELFLGPDRAGADDSDVPTPPPTARAGD